MNDLADFVALVHDEIGLPVTMENVHLDFDQTPGWDSVHLIALLAAVERETQRPVSLPEMLRARSLAEIYTRAVAR
ncbi:phosphopantetheine-binding protein [Catenulispora rubra]|uniref:phosphopantetheine-binding protein n=1 Tax=Catenulispora rubra TaxID=280293 RepID=UPI0018926D6C|nr:phosphopantetheine-binding protein [Catenulispora rubra]